MDSYRVTFPNQQTIELPASACAAIEQAAANYTAPLWLFRAERVLKLAGRQWVWPGSAAAAHALAAQHPAGIVAVAWKLFNRSWAGTAEEYFLDPQRYPDHPRRLGKGVIPLVDEDRESQQIGWVRIEQTTPMDANFAIFVQFTVLEMFEPQPLPREYA